MCLLVKNGVTPVGAVSKTIYRLPMQKEAHACCFEKRWWKIPAFSLSPKHGAHVLRAI